MTTITSDLDRGQERGAQGWGATPWGGLPKAGRHSACRSVRVLKIGGPTSDG